MMGLNLYKQLEHGSLYRCYDTDKDVDKAIEIDTTNSLSREQIDTLHDYCLFWLGSQDGLAGLRDFYAERLVELGSELEQLGVELPTQAVRVYSDHYPTSVSFAATIGGKLIFT